MPIDFEIQQSLFCVFTNYQTYQTTPLRQMFSGVRVYTTSDLSPNVLCNVIPNGRDQQGVTTDVML
jgi:hypothetical protein